MSLIRLEVLDFSSIGYPDVGQFILGVDVDGSLKLKRSSDTIVISPTGSNTIQYNSVSVSDFITLINTSLLKPGSIYLLSDFQTKHYIQYTDTAGDGTGMDELIHTGSTEPLVVIAISNNVYSTDVKSIYFPDDDIKWRHDLADREFEYAYNGGSGKGHITFRKDIDGNIRDYDFRNVVFRRWNDGSGNYTKVTKASAPFSWDYIEYKSFDASYQLVRKNEVGSFGSLNSGFGISYYLDNLIITTQSVAFGNKISAAHGVTIDASYFIENDISISFFSNFTAQEDVISFNIFNKIENTNIYATSSYNNIGFIYGSTFSSTFRDNSGSLIRNSSIGIAESNIFNSIEDCVIDDMNNNMVIGLSSIISPTYSYNLYPHNTHHLPNGSDALLIGTPSSIGLTNSIGTANAFVRQDHIHAHGNQPGGLLHATASTLSSGFMSSTDKIGYDSIMFTTQSSVKITGTAVSITAGIIDSSGSFGTNGQILKSTGTGSIWATSATGSYLYKTPVDPTGTTSSTSVMMGLGATLSITPIRSGNLVVNVSGDTSNSSSGDGTITQIRYGTGTYSSNGETASGISLGSSIHCLINSASGGSRVPISLNGIAIGLTLSVPYWFDLSLSVLGGGSASISDISYSIYEI